MDNKDFFDDEYDKLESKKASEQSQNANDWYGSQVTQSKQNNGNKPLYITLICVGLVLCIVLGWLLGSIFTNLSREPQSALFDDVLQYLETQYYKEIPDEKMWAAMEAAGTAMLQNAGDQFSRLMSPATYYEFCNPTSSMDTTENGSFGISFQLVEGIGMYVYEVVTDSSAYGKLQGEDLVYKITDIKTLNNTSMEDIVTNAVSSNWFVNALQNIQSAIFHVLRNGDVAEPVRVSRGFADYVDPDYPFEFIEFYFGDNFTNVSTSNVGSAATNTKDYRGLGELNNLKDTGYIRIKEFSYILVPDETDKDKQKIHSVVDEFKIVMDLFKATVTDEKGNVIKQPLKYLILDLKGNPGGSVEYVSQIAGMLATDAKLTDAERRNVQQGNQSIITTLKYRNGGGTDYTADLLYETYFGQAASSPNIVIWTDGGSASASELLTGALLDYKTAVQMGTTTYGKGIAQTWNELTDYTASLLVNGKPVTSCWAIYYTVAEYYSPVTHTNIHGIGYTPSAQYNGLDTYDKLWTETSKYFKTVSSGSSSGMLACA